MTDLFSKCAQYFQRLEKVVGGEFSDFLRRYYREFPVSNCAPHITLEGRTMLQVATNDYLGLALHPEAVAAAAAVASEHGAGTPLGARPLTGNTALHRELEQKLAAFRRTEDCLVHNLGLGAMSGTIASLVGREDRVFVDSYAHSCVHEGARLSKGKASWFRHNDLAELESQLRDCPPGQAKLIVVDGVYGMTGDLAPLPDLVELKHKYNARLFVDDAHGTGVLGRNGRGTAEHYGVEEEVDLHGGTFAKAFGTFGGYVAGPRAVMDYLRFASPSIVLTKALPAVITAATLKTLELIQRLPDRRACLWKNLTVLRDGLRQAGFDIGQPQAAVTSIFTRGAKALYAVRALEEEFGIIANAVMYPAVPFGTSIVRLTVSALHTPEDMLRVVEALAGINRRFPLQAER